MKITVKSHSSKISLINFFFNSSFAALKQSGLEASAVRVAMEKFWKSLFSTRKFLIFSADYLDKGLLSAMLWEMTLSLWTN